MPNGVKINDRVGITGCTYRRKQLMYYDASDPAHSFVDAVLKPSESNALDTIPLTGSVVEPSPTSGDLGPRPWDRPRSFRGAASIPPGDPTNRKKKRFHG